MTHVMTEEMKERSFDVKVFFLFGQKTSFNTGYGRILETGKRFVYSEQVPIDEQCTQLVIIISYEPVFTVSARSSITFFHLKKTSKLSETVHTVTRDASTTFHQPCVEPHVKISVLCCGTCLSTRA